MVKGESFSLTNKEFWYLISVSRKDYFIGAENPYRGWLTAEIQADQQKNKSNLIRNGIISSDPQYEAIFTPEYRKIFMNIFLAENCLIITSDPVDNKFTRRYVYFRKDDIIEAIHGEDKIYHFRQISDIPSFIEDFSNFYLLNFRPNSSSLKIQINREDFFKISNLLREGQIDSAESLFNVSANNQDPSKCLFNSLRKIEDNTAVSLIEHCYNREIRKTNGFAYIFGNSDLWLITTRNNSPQNTIIVELTSPTIILKRVKELLNQ